MTTKTLTVSILLVTSLLLLTGCNDNAKTETNTTTDTNTIIDGSDGNTATGYVNDDNPTRGSGDRDDNTTTSPTVTPTSINLTIDKTLLNKDKNTTVKVIATYSDNTTKELNTNIEWIMAPENSVEVNGDILTAKKDTNVALQAKVGATLSNTINLNITWTVNGHVLPPEPDPQVNNATLLGIDSNNNGVRDDVERWIYETYKDKHPIHIDIAMQAGRAYKKVLETPERAKEIREVVNGALFCGWYYWKDSYRYNEPTLVSERIDTPVKSKYFNTKERQDVYWQYDTLLSGDSYDLPRAKERKLFCDFNTSKYD